MPVQPMRILSAVLLLILAYAGPTSSQMIARATSLNPRMTTAEELETEATLLASQLDQRTRAARLFVAAAQLRAMDDSIAVVDLLKGAHLFYYAGDALTALPFMIEAARRAEHTGAVFRSADLYITAAVIASELSDLEAAKESVAAARHLIESSGLSDVERRFLTHRLRGDGKR